ncbi:PD40 domain-containing protein [Phycicoccus ginsengisoli]
MSTRGRLATLVALALVLVGGTAAYLVRSHDARQEAVRTAPAQATVAVATVQSGPRIVFRNTAIGPDYGRVAMVPLAAPGGARAFTGASCDRVFAASGHTLCLASDPGVVTTYTARAWADAGGPKVDLPLTGTPSRARLSDDAKLAATTSFVSGDSYAAKAFSTRTVVTTLATGASVDLETFRLVHRGRTVTPSDRNYWGVTFAPDDDHFYVTVQFGGKTWLASGRLSTRTVTTLRQDAECPSLSPDGTKVAYKKRGDRGPGDWRLAVMDLATGRETALAEQHSVDDQVEWLDDATILYGLPGEGTAAAESNVWAVPADGTGAPRLLIAKAWSPAVVR